MPSTIKDQIKKALDSFWSFSDDIPCDTILSRQEKPFAGMDPGLEDEAINDAFINDNNKWLHTEFVKKLRLPCIIEPDFSFAITGARSIVRETVPFPGLRPSVPRYIRSFFQARKHFQRAILFDGVFGRNYFHFFTEVITKVWLLDTIKGYESLPFIINENVYNRKYFQYLIHHTDLGRLQWVVQKKGDYIKVDELYIIKSMSFDSRHFARLKEWLKIPVPATRTKRVFINRPFKTGRYLENFGEILPILAKYNFEVVDLDNTTLEYQMELFAATSHLLSIHGAGQSNIIFADHSIGFTEILPGNRLSTHFYWLSMALGIASYNAIKGENLPATNTYPEKGFYISPEKVEQEIQRMLA